MMAGGSDSASRGSEGVVIPCQTRGWPVKFYLSLISLRSFFFFFFSLI